MKLRTAALTGVMSLAGLGLIGAGAHAQFDTSTTSNQVVTTGTPGVTLSGSCVAGPCAGNPSDLYALSNGGQTLTFTAGGPFGSSFTTGDEMVTATNTGNIPLTELIFNITSTYDSSPLATEAYMCVTSTGLGTSGNNYLLYNGPLAGGLNANWPQAGDTLTVAGVPPTNSSGNTDNYVINIYAGSETTQCGTDTSPGSTATPGTSTAPALNSDAQSESITISATMTYSG